MGILSWILFGLLAGIVAKVIMPGRDPGGFIVTILLGVVGAFLGGFVAAQLGLGSVQGFDIRSFIIAVGGAILVLVIYRSIRR
ncbi:MAG TPA: GlsB/YeaQ/YmgE family stress response membrane protein [Alphaproteobacteria bacterium]|nr:GlsB/YeaQ/YmgE family stress response membrane protein [Alphaproteobacteria bacterium]